MGPRTLSLNFSSCHLISKPKSVPEMGYGVESWWKYFVWCSDNSFHGIGMPFNQDPKSGIKIFTHNIYTQGKFLNKNYLDSLLSNRASPALLPHSVAFPEQSQRSPLPYIHLERTAASVRMIPTKEESIGSLTKQAAE